MTHVAYDKTEANMYLFCKLWEVDHYTNYKTTINGLIEL